MPGPLDTIFGQAQPIAELRSALAAGRLPHAMLFAGPVGVGKGTLAAALARVVLCHAPPASDTPCGRCPSCVAFDGDAHPDYHVVMRSLIRYYDKTGTSKGIELSIDVVRPEVIDRANVKPVLGKGRFFVIEEAETMTAFAANALLKTLEEPQGKSTFVLLTDAPESLPMTIRSRSRMVRFGPLPGEVVARLLAGRGLDAAAAERAAEIAGGSAGKALRWIEDGVIAKAADLRQRVDRLVAGAGGAGELPGWLRTAADEYAAAQLARDPQGSKDLATRTGLDLYLSLAADRCRAAMRQTDDPDRLSDLCEAIEALDRAGQFIAANVNVALVLQQLAQRLTDALTTGAS